MRLFCALLLSLTLCGCPSATAPNQPPPPIATGYGSAADQTLGQSLAALRAFAASAKDDYSRMSPSSQQQYKIPLNSLILAVDAADQTYIGYHTGLTTIDVAQQAYTRAKNEQTAYTSMTKGVK